MYFVIGALSLLTAVLADTPANCTYEDVQGRWRFQIGSRGHDNTISCATVGSGIEVKYGEGRGLRADSYKTFLKFKRKICISIFVIVYCVLLMIKYTVHVNRDLYTKM